LRYANGKVALHFANQLAAPHADEVCGKIGFRMSQAHSILAFHGGLPAWLKWLRDPVLVVAVSLGLAILGLVSLLALPFLLARIPTDYFVTPLAPTRRGSAHWIGRVAKNLLGGILLLLGIAMLVLPGQGVLTILAALLFLYFPGKHRVERWLVLKPRVLRVVNEVRARGGRPPLALDQPVCLSPSRRGRD